MKNIKFFTVSLIVLAFLIVQTSGVFAAPAPQGGSIEGTISAIECITDAPAGEVDTNVTVVVTIEDAAGAEQIVELDQATAESLGLIKVMDGVADCSEEALAAVIGMEVSIPLAEEEEPKHPVGNALSQYFSDITDYDAIMAAHENGMGFGLIAQALWLTQKMEGDSDTFLAILDAKKTKDFSAFVLEDGSTPTNWGQFKKAVLNGDKKNNLGVVMSHRNNEDHTNNGNGNGNNHNNDKTNNGNGRDKDKTNNGKGPDKQKDKN